MLTLLGMTGNGLTQVWYISVVKTSASQKEAKHKSCLNNYILGRFFFSHSFNCIYFILIEANNSVGLQGERSKPVVLCASISCQMLINHMHRFNIYEIKQIAS